jgi:hypothetical protein
MPAAQPFAVQQMRASQVSTLLVFVVADKPTIRKE